MGSHFNQTHIINKYYINHACIYEIIRSRLNHLGGGGHTNDQGSIEIGYSFSIENVVFKIICIS